MVSEAVLGAIVGGSAAIVGSLVQAWFGRQNTKDQIESQKDRRVGEFYLEQKVNALTVYHAELERFVEEIRLYKSHAYGDELTEEEWSEEVAELYNSYHQALTHAAIFLTEEQHEVLDQTLAPFREASEHVKDSISEELLILIGEGDWNYGEVVEVFLEAREVVKNEIQEGVSRLEP